MVAAPIDKAAVARNFSGAAGGYDRSATAQACIAAGLVRRLPEALEPGLVVDLGCGTGLLTGGLLARFPRASLLGIDLAEGMVAICRERWRGEPRARFACADAECEASLATGAGLVASSCALQWFVDPAAAVEMWARALRPGGAMALAALESGSFGELDAAHREALGAPLGGLRLPTAQELGALVRKAGLAPVLVESESITTWHLDARAALRSFRETGALLSGLSGWAPLGLGQMRRLLAAYERLRGEGGVPMTFRSVYAIARVSP